MLRGLNIIRKILDPKAVYIAIEDNKEDAISHLEKLIANSEFRDDFKIVPLKSKYPMGAEKTLIKMLLGREVPIGKLPLDAGVVVHNASTAKAIYDAIYEGKPLIERVVTITGAVKQPKNLLTRFGTSICSLINYCGSMNKGANKLIMGGPMMGIAQFDLDFPVVKGTNCLVVQESKLREEHDCIRCGKCIEVCPMGLMPTDLARYAKAGRYDECKEKYIDDCVECGACAFTCPANIPIVQYVKVVKKELAKGATR